MPSQPSLSRRVSLLLAALSVLVPSLALAETGVLVIPAEPGVELEGIAAEVEGAGFAPRELGPARSVFDKAVEAESDRQQSALTALSVGLEAARAKYLEQDFDTMLDELVSLREATLWLTAQNENRQILWDLCFHIGLSYWGQKKNKKAIAEFSFASSVLPDKRPPADVYGPDVSGAYAKAVLAVSQSSAQPFRIQNAPPDARISIDGVALISTTGVALVPGLHAVRVSAPGHQTMATIADTREQSVLPGKLEELGGDVFSRAGVAWATGSLRPASSPSAKLLLELASERDAELVLWVAKDKVVVVGSDGRSTADLSDSKLRATRNLLAKVGREGTTGADFVHGGKSKDSNNRKWLIAGGVGVAVVAAVAIGVVLASSGDGSPGGGGGRVQIGIVP